MGPYSVWPFMSGFFHVTQCLQGSSVLWRVSESPSFLWLNNRPCVYPFISWWAFGLFPPFGYCEYCRCEHTCTSIWVSVFHFLGYIPRSRIVGAHANSMFSFLGNHQTVFHSGCTISPEMYRGSKVITSLPTVVFCFGEFICLFALFVLLQPS